MARRLVLAAAAIVFAVFAAVGTLPIGYALATLLRSAVFSLIRGSVPALKTFGFGFA